MVNTNVLAGSLLAVDAITSRKTQMPGPVMPVKIDEQLFQILYRRTAGELRAYVARVLGNASHADDIVQESYLRLVRSPPATTDLSQLRAWLFRIASHLIVDHWRRAKREYGRPESDALEPQTRGPDVALRVDMTRVFEQLTPQQRQLMWLAYVEGADHHEIAQAINVRPGSVRVLLYRARRRLARLLGGNGQKSKVRP